MTEQAMALLCRGLDQLGLPWTQGTAEQLALYGDRLLEKNQVMNLTAITDPEEVVKRHFLDSAALLPSKALGGRKVIDVGTGAGFPGLVLKILDPTIQLTLLDSLGKRVDFLRDCCQALELTDTECVCARAEEAPEAFRAAFDIATSRAVARLNVLCELCLPFVKPGGLFIAMKGPNAAEELEEAGKAIHVLGGRSLGIREYTIPDTDVKHCAVLIEKTGTTPEKYPRRWAKIAKQPL